LRAATCSPTSEWLAAIEELEHDGLDQTPVPSHFPQELELQQVSYLCLPMSEGSDSKTGRWASGASFDGRGEIEYVEKPMPFSDDDGLLSAADPRLHGTSEVPVAPEA